MSKQFNISQSVSYKENINISNNNSNQNLLPYINISKGKIITLLKAVFSFLNDNSLLKMDSFPSFEKYIIDTKLIQTMSKTFYFYTSNDPENGKTALHELIKEKYSKFLKYFEQNINYFSNSKELQFRYYIIQGFILLWLIETKYDTKYYDDLIRLVNSIVILDNESTNDKNYLKNFLNIIIKFPFIKQNKEMILKVLEVIECNDTIINYFNENLNNYIKKKNSAFKKDIFNENAVINIGKKNIKTKNHDSYFPLIQENAISHKRKSLSNTGSQKNSLTSINSSGFYTPEFKHSKRDSIRHFRRFTMNNINNPKTSFITNKSESFSRANSMSDGMNNLLNKCEEGKHINKSINNSYNNDKNNCPGSTKSKLRLAIQGHFYTEDDYKNNIDFANNNNTSKFSLNSEISENRIENNINNNIIEDDDLYDGENEMESKLVSVDELPINPNMSIISNSNSKNIGIEPENIIQETKEEEENDENDQINEKNNNNSHNNNYIKILTDNEINDFFNQQFSDNKNNKKNQITKNTNNNNNYENKNKNKKIVQNKNKKNISDNNNNNSNNSSRNNSLNNNLFNKNQKKDILINKEKKNSKKNISFTSNLFKDKSKEKNKLKENNISIIEKMKNYSNSNVFGIIKNHKNNKNNIRLKNKNENKILQPMTKGKDLVNNALNKHNNGHENISKEKLPTDSVAKKNLLSLYNQLKVKK